MNINDHAKNCILCELIHDNSHDENNINCIILETDHLYVVAGMGAWIEKYYLIISKRHELRFFELLKIKKIREEFDLLKNILIESILANNDNYVVYEHGVSESSSKGASCVNHAHIHICPIKDPKILSVKIEKEIPLIEENKIKHNDYVYLESENSKKYFFINKELPRQFCRRLIYQDYGIEEKWNYAIHPFEENMLSTIKLTNYFLYKKTISTYSKNHESKIYKKTFLKQRSENITNELIKFSKKIKDGGLLLDVGCGTGDDVLLLRENGVNSFGIDISKEMLSHTNSPKESNSLYFYEGDALNLSNHLNKRFDALVSITLFQHLNINQIVKVLSEFKKIITENGIIFIAVKTGNKNCIDTRLGINSPRISHTYTSSFFKEKIHEAGFIATEEIVVDSKNFNNKEENMSIIIAKVT